MQAVTPVPVVVVLALPILRQGLVVPVAVVMRLLSGLHNNNSIERYIEDGRQ
jgi:hypothetical protein